MTITPDDKKLLTVLKSMNSIFGRGDITAYQLHMDGKHEITRHVRGASGGTFCENVGFRLKPAKKGTTVCFAGHQTTIKQ